MIGYIYKITNKINNMSYYGQTIQSLNKRLQDHFRKESHCSYLKNAISFYGKENFEIILVDTAISDSKNKLFVILNDLEEKYIKENNTLYPNGYNLTTGGNQSRLSQESIDKRVKKCKKSIICNETGKIYPSIKEAAESFGAKAEAIHRVLRGKRKSFRNLTFSYYDSKPIKFSKESKIRLSAIGKTQKHISKFLTKEQIDRMGTPVMCNETKQLYSSLTQAADKLNLSISKISLVLSGKRKSHKGFTFSYPLSQS